MRYANGHREKSRERILAAAGRGFRKSGYSGIGVDGLAKEAGVTSGAFYGHFASKETAFQEAVTNGVEELRETVEALRAQHGPGWLVAFVDLYLGFKRTCDLSESCALQSFSPEVGRSGEGIRAAFQIEIAKVVAAVAEGLPGGPPAEREKRAWALLSTLSGAVTIARAIPDPAVGEAIAAGARSAALAVAGYSEQS